jgi:hypothetical protein
MDWTIATLRPLKDEIFGTPGLYSGGIGFESRTAYWLPLLVLSEVSQFTHAKQKYHLKTDHCHFISKSSFISTI